MKLQFLQRSHWSSCQGKWIGAYFEKGCPPGRAIFPIAGICRRSRIVAEEHKELEVGKRRAGFTPGFSALTVPGPAQLALFGLPPRNFDFDSPRKGQYPISDSRDAAY
jgi:hypothetical protein